MSIDPLPPPPSHRPLLTRSQSDNPLADGPPPNRLPSMLSKKRHSTHIVADETLTPSPSPSPSSILRPSRPTRVGAPPVALSRSRSAKVKISSRPRTATGSMEDVTPWELYPAPGDELGSRCVVIAESSSQNLSRASTSMRPSSSGGRPSGRTFADHLRRRKSTGSKTPAKNPVGSNFAPFRLQSSASAGPLGVESFPKTSHSVAPSNSHRNHPHNVSKPPSSSGAYKPSQNPTLTPPVPPVPTAWSGVVHAGPFVAPPSASQSRSSPDQQGGKGKGKAAKFSTADRTVLEELKRSLNARAAQFVVKNGSCGSGKSASATGSGISWGASGLGAVGVFNGKKHHPFGKDEIPYPRCYEKDVLDLDIWDTHFCRQICESLTWHVFEKPPTKVLDIGCGTGAWILECARTWRDCHFVGLDCVPLHPDLLRVGSSDLAHRITWTQSNFLDYLPFPNEEFDFVHIKRIALGVPEDKWDHLFEEIVRVMKPGAAFEMIEEDLFFPGCILDGDEDRDSDFGSETRSFDEPHRRFSGQGLRSTPRNGSWFGRKSEEVGSPLSTNSSPSLLPTGSTSGASNYSAPVTPPSMTLPLPLLPMSNTAIIEDDEDEMALYTIRDRSEPRKSLTPPSPPASLEQRLTAPSTFNATASQHRRNSDERLVTRSPTIFGASRSKRPSTSTGIEGRRSPGKAAVSPFLTRSLPKEPPNPRDHSLLETIYKEMQASRFINTSPLSLLPNALGLHFKDVRSQPPIRFAFPPLRPKQTPQEEDSDSDPDEEARNAINPYPAQRLQSVSQTSTESSQEDRWVSAQSLLLKTSAYVSLDESRLAGFSPRTSSAVTKSPPSRTIPLSDDTAPVNPARLLQGKGLPNSNLNIDVQALNLNLALRAAEILGCSEEMWECVLQYQREARRTRKDGASRNVLKMRSKSVDAARHRQNKRSSVGGWSEPEDPITLLEDLTREEFEGLLIRFDLDMQDHMALGSQMEERFSWSVSPSPPSVERKAFDAAWERWCKWDEEQRNRPPPRGSRPTSLILTNPIDVSRMNHNECKLPARDQTLLSRGFPARLPETRGTPSQRSSTPRTDTTAPTKRLSRILGVFVAWKAEESGPES
ncbi:uncharacterized protein EV420DRAFT_1638002 [Desarmillaria tabescens]|uniref:Methyltransferase domain-containing protein n=1 Tax=Armillaria tabescens TaxID=1929756 RepID=A0AA39TV97_ARMTA|nr:uncharacterized protein EV420DRAFT_1638002 [Desarmillaria tabescens]KAK0464444.1 hypothetical protein EV420DRAFT_1638002 [Desarmillaria tabescens]